MSNTYANTLINPNARVNLVLSEGILNAAYAYILRRPHLTGLDRHIEASEEIIQLQPQNPVGHFLKGTMYSIRGEVQNDYESLQKAVESLTKAIDLGLYKDKEKSKAISLLVSNVIPIFETLRRDLATLLGGNAFQTPAETAHYFRGRSLLLLYDHLFDQGKTDQLEDLLSRSVDDFDITHRLNQQNILVNPNKGLALNLLSRYYLARNRGEDAYRAAFASTNALGKSLEREDKNAEYFYLLGVALVVMERYKEALDKLLRAKNLDMTTIKPDVYLGIAQWNLGQAEEAIDSFTNVLVSTRSFEEERLRNLIYALIRAEIALELATSSDRKEYRDMAVSQGLLHENAVRFIEDEVRNFLSRKD